MRLPHSALYVALGWLTLLVSATSGRAGTAPAPAAQPKPARFEAEIAAYETADRKSPPPTGAVLFIGSSSIRLWKTLAQDFPELTIINRGFGGSVIAESVRYAPRIVIPYKPRMVVLYAGGNDLKSGLTPAQVLKDFQAFAAEVHAALPRTRIVYVSINPSVARWNLEEQTLEANRLIEQFIRENDSKTGKLSFIDSHSRLLSPEGKPRPEILLPDGLHLNSKGYELWTSILKPEILRLAALDKD